MAANLEMEKEMIGSAFDGDWNDWEKDSFHCLSLLCNEVLITKQLIDPIAIGKGRCLFVKTSMSPTADSTGENDCMTGWGKALCCFLAFSIHNISCGCMDKMCCGTSHIEDLKLEEGERGIVEASTMLAHCLCFSCGFTPACCEPPVAGHSQYGCMDIKANSEGEIKEDGQYVRVNVKMLFAMVRFVCLPSSDIGCGCCGLDCCGPVCGPAGGIGRTKPLVALFKKQRLTSND